MREDERFSELMHIQLLVGNSSENFLDIYLLVDL